MAMSPQQLTISLYSAHRAVIFAIAQLSCISDNVANIRLWRLLYNWRYINTRIHSFIHSFIQKFAVNSENTSILETIVLNGPSVSSKVTDFGKNWKHLLPIDHQQYLGDILPHFRDSASSFKNSTPFYSIRILGCSPCTKSKMLDLRDAKTLS